MKHKKASTTEKADKVFQRIGTAGGPIGAPQLVGFGGTDTMSQLAAVKSAGTKNVDLSRVLLKPPHIFPVVTHKPVRSAPQFL